MPISRQHTPGGATIGVQMPGLGPDDIAREIAAHAQAQTAASGKAKPTAAEMAATLLAEEIAEIEANVERLRTDLSSAHIMAEGAAAMLSAAEAQWARAEKHSQAEADQLMRLRDEAPAVAARVTELERAISEATERLTTIRRNVERERMLARAREVYTPAVTQLGAAVRTLLDALAVEQKARNTLEREGAWDKVYGILGAQLGVFDSRGGDDLLPALRRWIAEAREKGYTV